MRSSEGTPGGSAAREYARRCQRREDRARAKLGGLGVALVRLTDEPQTTKSWKKGAEGEQLVARRLAKHLDGSGVLLLHDRRIPGSRANIDHLAIGPGGVTVIDAKNLKGKAEVRVSGLLFGPRKEELRINGRDRSHLIEGLEKQVDIVQSVIAGLGHEGLPVAGALCFADGAGLPVISRLRMHGMLIEAPRRVAALAKRSGTLPPSFVARLRDELAAALPAA